MGTENERNAPPAEASAKNNPLGARNMGEPIRLTDANIHAIVAETTRPGEKASVWTRLLLTSDQQLFHRIIPNLARVIEACAQNAGSYVSLAGAHTVLLVMRPDNSAELWVDAAAMMSRSHLRPRGNLAAGTVLFENDIIDDTSISFPFVEIRPEDRIVCIIREGWRFALLCDFNPDGILDLDRAQRDLATLCRRLKYADRFALFAHEASFYRLVETGWFPFLELVNSEFKALAAAFEAGFGTEDAEQDLIRTFDEERVERMFERWMTRLHLKDREGILRSAVNAYKAQDAVAAIKIILTEIEGVLSEAYFQAGGERTHKIGTLLDFVVSAAEQRAGGKDTLFFPAEFARYLRDHTYAGFEPGKPGKAGSRNAVGHGAVKASHYTQARALQAILTLDQLAFYT